MRHCIILLLFFILGGGKTFAQRDSSFYWNGDLKSVGKQEIIQDDSNSFALVKVGLWKYWDEYGQITLEEYYNPQCKVVNAWLSNGKQTIKNGNGIYYIVEWDCDSLVFTYRDSMLNGTSWHYNCVDWNVPKRFLQETGNYSNGKKSGTWTRYYPNGVIREKANYENGEQNGAVMQYYPTGKLHYEGTMLDGKGNGLWKSYDSSGVLIWQCEYKDGSPSGIYNEYYRDGTLKTSGKYRHVKRRICTQVEDPTNPGSYFNSWQTYDRCPARYGKWKYYNRKGKCIAVRWMLPQMDRECVYFYSPEYLVLY